MKFKTIISAAVFASILPGQLLATEFDYDGDGLADVAVRRPGTQFWYIKNSSGSDRNSDRGDNIQRIRFGLQETDIPVPEDYDGDGITDVAVRRGSNSTWYVLNSSGNNTNSTKEDGIQREVFGRNSADIPVPADYDGDGIADFAVRRASTFTWYIKNSSGSNFNSERGDGIQRIVFGRSEADIPVKGDFDGDGKFDIAVKRQSNGTWYIKNSSGDNTNSTRGDGIQRIEFATAANDIPVPADYDGDGITDIAYRNPNNFTWYIRSSMDGSVTEIEFGLHPADIPVPADYDGDGKADLAIRRAGDQSFVIYNPEAVPPMPGLVADSDKSQRLNSLINSKNVLSSAVSNNEDDSEVVEFGGQSGDIPVNASGDQVRGKLEDTNDTGGSDNNLPSASAGDDQTVTVGNLVTLDGSASADEDNDSLTYSWTFRNMPDGSSASLSNADTVSPSFTPDIEGNYLVALTVNDGTDDSAADRVRITAEAAASENNAPVANAGADQTVSVGDRVQLDGSGSSDADGDSLTYSWSITSMPDGSEAQLGRTDLASPRFTADVAGTYTVQLIVNDGTTDSEADSVTIVAEAVFVNTAPVAEAGADQTATVGDTVTFDGSGSTDSDGDSLSYSWSISSSPSSSSASLSNSSSVSPTLVPDVAGDYTISLVVNDGTEDSSADSMTLSVEAANSAPVANAGSDQTVTTGATVSLSGSGSSDADGDTLTYSWSLTTQPSGSSATLNNSTSVSASFTPDVTGTYVATLSVSDGAATDSDTVSITAQAAVTETDAETRLQSTFDANRFAASADATVAARPYVSVDFVDHDRDGTNDAALLQSNGVPYTYDYDYTTSDTDNTANTCFDDPNNGPDDADNGGCYAIEASVRAFIIPVTPELADSTTSIGSDHHSGMAISGATFELPTAPSPEDSTGYAITNVYDDGWEVLDDCNGHSGYLGAPYHYHGDPTYPINDGTNEHTQRATEASDCLPDYELVVDEATGHAPLIGYMADGFPIYGTDGYDVGDALDDCNGHFSATGEYPSGIYHYHALNYDVVTANGTGNRNEEPPLPECLSGKVWLIPEFHSPELSETIIGKDVDTEISVESTNTTVDALTLAQTYGNYRFSATANAEARPYVYVELIDWDFDGNNDTAMLLSNGVPSQYDYDNSTSDSNDTQNVCFDDPSGGPDSGCYTVDANNRVFLFSLNPTQASSETTISDNDHSGMAISGGTFVHPNEDSPSGAGYAVTNTYDDAWEVLDDCNGNVSNMGGPYHYHGDPSNPTRDTVDEHTATAVRAAGCLPNFSKDVDDTNHAAVIGFMADGFPIYGEEGYDEGDELDSCNGHTGVTQEFPNGIYHYHALTADTATSAGKAPLPTCLKGEVLFLPNYPTPELSEATN